MKVFRALKDLPMKHKLVLICMLTTACALLLASVTFIASELISLRHSMISNLDSSAEAIASNVKSALAFQDNKSAEEVLGTLKVVNDVRAAVIYDGGGRVFASYRRDNLTPYPSVIPIGAEIHRFGLKGIELYHPIRLDNEPVGAVYVSADMSLFYSRVIRYAITLFGVMGLSLLMSFLLAARLRRTVARPVEELATVMGTISQKKDYSVRAAIRSRDEIGSLAEGFNEMVANIQVHEKELEGYRKNLEELVRRRTAQLTDMNMQLKNELSVRQRAEKALAESEYLYRTIFETTGNANLIVGADDLVVMVNTAFEKLSGYEREEIEGKLKWTDFFTPDMLDQMKHYRERRKTATEDVPLSYETRFVTKTGSFCDVYINTANVPVSSLSVASLLDLTDFKRLEAQLYQSQKIEAIGQLAGGVAHDFNNILTAIIGYASLLRMNMAADNPMKSYADSVLTSAERAAHLTQGLLAFSRKQVIAPKPIKLNTVIKNVERLLVRLMGEHIELKTSYNSEDITVFADAGQIEQVLMNFATNARDSMKDGGAFSVTTGKTVVDDPAPGKGGPGKPGKYALIAVSDTGGGIDEETMEHIFEPFFTTKGVGEGTGLGLSIVYGIIKQHNGHIEVQSKKGRGTTFKIYLPLIKSEVAEAQSGEIPRRPVGGTETILLAEDDKQSRALIREVLERFGYTIVEAVDGDDALEKFADAKDRMSLVILDVIMPKKDGRTTYGRIKEIDPGMKALFMSGYTADIIHRKGIYEDNLNFLSKPVLPYDLATKVREILDSDG